MRCQRIGIRTTRALWPYLMWIEIWIEYDHCVRSPQVNSYTPSTSTQDIDEHIWIRFVEFIHVFLAISLLCITILYKTTWAEVLSKANRSLPDAKIWYFPLSRSLRRYRGRWRTAQVDWVNTQMLIRIKLYLTWLNKRTRCPRAFNFGSSVWSRRNFALAQISFSCASTADNPLGSISRDTRYGCCKHLRRLSMLTKMTWNNGSLSQLH